MRRVAISVTIIKVHRVGFTFAKLIPTTPTVVPGADVATATKKLPVTDTPFSNPSSLIVI